MINTIMKKNNPNDFFDNVNFLSIVDNIKNIYTSDGAMSVLLDFERVLSEAFIYSFENWELGELVQGPIIKKYTVSCTFMYHKKNMPNPQACKRLLLLGCNILWKKTKLTFPIKVENYDDFIPGTRYPKSVKEPVWLISIEIPKDLMSEVREGSIDLAGQNIDLSELDDSYNEDLDKEDTKTQETDAMGAPVDMGMGGGMGGGLGPTPPPMTPGAPTI